MAFAIRSARASVAEASCHSICRHECLAGLDAQTRVRGSETAPYGLSLGNLACRNLAEISEEERVLALRHAAQTSYPESAGVIRPRAPCVFRASPSALARCCVSTQ